MYKAFHVKQKGNEHIIPYREVRYISVFDNETTLKIALKNNKSQGCSSQFLFEGMNPTTVRDLLDGYEDWLQS